MPIFGKLRRTSLSALFLVIGSFLLYSSLSIDMKGADFAVSPRAVPFGLSLIMTAIAVWSLVLDVVKTRGARGALDLHAIRLILGFLAVVFAYVFLIGIVNFHVLTFFFLIAAFFYLGARSPGWAVGGAASLVAAEFLIFQYGFKVSFP